MNLCGAELEKQLLSENQTPYLLTVFAPFIFLEKKRGDLQSRTCNEDWCPSQRANVVFVLLLLFMFIFCEHTSIERTGVFTFALRRIAFYLLPGLSARLFQQK